MLTGLGQLLYTSFPGTGLQKLASEQVPSDVQDAFLHHIVYSHWNSYNPPSSGERAIYLHQPGLESCLFGWLYSDGIDEHNRHIPCFIGYFLAEALNRERLQQILMCLQKGPMLFWNYGENANQVLEPISIENIDTYQPARKGLPISQEFRNNSYSSLESAQLLDLFVFDQQPALSLPAVSNDSSSEHGQMIQTVVTAESSMQESILHTAGEAEIIIQELIDKPLDIQCAFLVSPQGQPITRPAGMDENSALILAGTMIYLAQSTSEELQWESVEKIYIQGREGYIILIHCTSEAFLLVQAGKTLMGLLDGELNRTTQKLKDTLTGKTSMIIAPPPQFNPQALSELNGTVDLVQDTTDIMYRGNPVQRG